MDLVCSIWLLIAIASGWGMYFHLLAEMTTILKTSGGKKKVQADAKCSYSQSYSHTVINGYYEQMLKLKSITIMEYIEYIWYNLYFYCTYILISIN